MAFSEYSLQLKQAALDDDVERCKALLEAGADPNADLQENTALISAILRGSRRIVALLLDAGADANHPNHRGAAPIHYVGGEDSSILMLLIKHGANVGAFAQDVGKTALHLVREPPLIKALVAAGADANERCAKGETPMHRATSDACITLAKLGASTNAISDAGLTPLDLACELDDVATGLTLIALGAKPALSPPKNRAWKSLFATPPLHAAARMNHVHLFADLVSRGHRIDEKHRGQTAKDWAIRTGHHDAAAALDALAAMDAMNVAICGNRGPCKLRDPP